MTVPLSDPALQGETQPDLQTPLDNSATVQHGAMSVDTFCERYGVSRSKAYQEIGAGRLKPKKLGRRTLITVADAEAWLASLPTGLDASTPSPRDAV